MKYTTIDDAKTALGNSGVVDFFDYDELDEVAEWMWRNDATPEQAGEALGAMDQG